MTKLIKNLENKLISNFTIEIKTYLIINIICLMFYLHITFVVVNSYYRLSTGDKQLITHLCGFFFTHIKPYTTNILICIILAK